MLRFLPVLALLSGCASGPQGVATLGCGGEVQLRNTGQQTVEQAYFRPVGAVDWGQDRLAPGTLPPGAAMTVTANPGINDVRLVFTNGRAAEMPALDICTAPVLTIQPQGLLAGR